MLEDWRELARRALRSRSFVLGGVITSAFVATALLSFVWTPYPFAAIDVANKLQPPSALHPLGTDQFGRDVLSMVMAGARNSMAVALVAVGMGPASAFRWARSPPRGATGRTNW